MKYSFRWGSALAGLFLLGATAVLAAACGGDETGASDLVSACEDYCEAQAGPGCAKGQPADTCKSQCGALPSVLEGQCVAEYTATFDCASKTEFTCVSDFPVPNGCLTESQALVQCQQDAPCKGFCKSAVAAGCGGVSEDACLSACKAEVEAADFCDHELEDLRECEGKEGVQCVDGKPHTTVCAEEKRDFADCLAFDDECAGYCWLADDAGCPGSGGKDGCVMSCQTKLGASSCQFEYRQLLQCAVDNGVTCNGADPTTSSCATEQQAYDACAMQNP